MRDDFVDRKERMRKFRGERFPRNWWMIILLAMMYAIVIYTAK